MDQNLTNNYQDTQNISNDCLEEVLELPDCHDGYQNALEQFLITALVLWIPKGYHE